MFSHSALNPDQEFSAAIFIHSFADFFEVFIWDAKLLNAVSLLVAFLFLRTFNQSSKICLLTPRSKKDFLKLNKGKEINGYENHIWNGVTCLELSKIIGNIIQNNIYWKGVRHIFSEKITKYNLSLLISNIYHLDLKYKSKENLKNWISTLFSEEINPNDDLNGFILQSEPGTGKTIWMLQKVCKLFKKNFKTTFSSDTLINIIPVFIPLKNFALREINDKQFIFFHDVNLIELNEKLNDHQKIYDFWSRLLNIAIRKRGSELWGKAFIKLFIKYITH